MLFNIASEDIRRTKELGQVFKPCIYDNYIEKLQNLKHFIQMGTKVTVKLPISKQHNRDNNNYNLDLKSLNSKIWGANMKERYSILIIDDELQIVNSIKRDYVTIDISGRYNYTRIRI